MIKVENKKRHINAESHYYYTKGNDGIDYLFSGSQLKVAIERAEKNPEDLPKNLISKFTLGMVSGCALGCIVMLVFSLI